MSRHLRRHFVDGEPPFRWIQNSRPSDGPSTPFSVASCGITYSASGLLDLLVAHGLDGGCCERKTRKVRGGTEDHLPTPHPQKGPFFLRLLLFDPFFTRVLPSPVHVCRISTNSSPPYFFIFTLFEQKLFSLLLLSFPPFPLPPLSSPLLLSLSQERLARE